MYSITTWYFRYILVLAVWYQFYLLSCPHWKLHEWTDVLCCWLLQLWEKSESDLVISDKTFAEDGSGSPLNCCLVQRFPAGGGGRLDQNSCVSQHPQQTLFYSSAAHQLSPLLGNKDVEMLFEPIQMTTMIKCIFYILFFICVKIHLYDGSSTFVFTAD